MDGACRVPLVTDAAGGRIAAALFVEWIATVEIAVAAVAAAVAAEAVGESGGLDSISIHTAVAATAASGEGGGEEGGVSIFHRCHR